MTHALLVLSLVISSSSSIRYSTPFQQWIFCFLFDRPLTDFHSVFVFFCFNFALTIRHSLTITNDSRLGDLPFILIPIFYPFPRISWCLNDCTNFQRFIVYYRCLNKKNRANSDCARIHTEKRRVDRCVSFGFYGITSNVDCSIWYAAIEITFATSKTSLGSRREIGMEFREKSKALLTPCAGKLVHGP